MSWSITLKADTDIRESDVDAVVRKTPDSLQSAFPGISSIKQIWGWGCATDIMKPQGNTLNIRGAGFSAQHAEPVAKFMSSELRKIGYTIRRSRISY